MKRGISASNDEGAFHKVVIGDDGGTGDDTKMVTQHVDVSTPPQDYRVTNIPLTQNDMEFSATASSSADTSMKLSALDKYVAQRSILGADLTEVVNPEEFERMHILSNGRPSTSKLQTHLFNISID